MFKGMLVEITFAINKRFGLFKVQQGGFERSTIVGWKGEVPRTVIQTIHVTFFVVLIMGVIKL
jgi:hypothetical protein